MFRRNLYASFVVITFIVLPAFSYEPWHNSAVGKISKDTASSLLLSASLDNTLKLWDLSTGALLRTFTLPSNARQTGQLFSCALSPDGKIAAASGWHSSYNGVSYSIYFFSVESGKLINTVITPESAALDLKFSHNGAVIAAAFKRGGVKVFDVNTGGLISSLQSHSAPVYTIAFSKNGELLSADSQGVVRYYSNNFKLIKSVKIAGRRVLSSVSVSADGTLAALGFERPGGVMLIALPSLVKVRELRFNDSKRCGAVLVEWAQSSNTIVGTFGRVYGDVQTSLFRWEIEGYRFKETALSGYGVSDIKVLPDGSIVYGGIDGEWGVVDSLGRIVYKIKKPSQRECIQKFTMELISPASAVSVYDSTVFIVLELRGADKLLDFELYVNGVRQAAVFTDVFFEYEESRRRVLVPLVNGKNRIVLWGAAVCGKRASVTAVVYRRNRAG
ncbi:MAG: hypothetical protein LBB56_03465 [Chitinispirillales bacterium]|jgi:hypothetical protein|nr:hypothetical protein [Chitinispirillales bacterium]